MTLLSYSACFIVLEIRFVSHNVASTRRSFGPYHSIPIDTNHVNQSINQTYTHTYHTSIWTWCSSWWRGSIERTILWCPFAWTSCLAETWRSSFRFSAVVLVDVSIERRWTIFIRNVRHAYRYEQIIKSNNPIMQCFHLFHNQSSRGTNIQSINQSITLVHPRQSTSQQWCTFR